MPSRYGAGTVQILYKYGAATAMVTFWGRYPILIKGFDAMAEKNDHLGCELAPSFSLAGSGLTVQVACKILMVVQLPRRYDADTVQAPCMYDASTAHCRRG